MLGLFLVGRMIPGSVRHWRFGLDLASSDFDEFATIHELGQKDSIFGDDESSSWCTKIWCDCTVHEMPETAHVDVAEASGILDSV